MKRLVVCSDCGLAARLVNGAAIYPHRRDLWSKNFWRCECGAYVGCHQGTSKPLGSPAGPETREARMAAHSIFDAIWRADIAAGVSKGFARSSAYRWLSKQLGTPPENTHIGMFDRAMAQRVVEVCRARQKDRTVMRSILILATVTTLAGCSTQEMAELNTALMVYTQDARTGLCFAMYLPGANSGLATNVPCTPEVLALATGATQ